MKVLVAGGAGYIGSHMCKCLHDAGHEVVVLDNLATGHRAAGEALDVQIFGTDYATQDGTCVRDYIHVDDLADAHLRAVEFLGGHEGFHAFNLGNGEGYSVREVTRATEEIVGRPLDIPVGPRRAGDPAVLVASSRKARDTLGWHPQRPGIRQIVEDAWAWHRAPAF